MSRIGSASNPFQACLLESSVPDSSLWEGSIDEATTKLTKCVQTAATKAFCPLPRKRKKHWITDDTWHHIRDVSIARRSFLDLGSSVTLCLMSCSFHAWKLEVIVNLSFQRCPSSSPAERVVMNDKVQNQSQALVSAKQLKKNTLQTRANARLQLECLQAVVRKRVRTDRVDHYDEIAGLGATCPARGGGCGLWNNIKKLNGLLKPKGFVATLGKVFPDTLHSCGYTASCQCDT